MIVGGTPGLFPLSKLNSGWTHYFMNGAGKVFSTKKDPAIPRQLNGRRTPSGHYFALAPSNGYSSTSERADALYSRARNHADFKRETTVATDINAATPHNSACNKLQGTPADRNHAITTQEGIKARGYVIARVEGEALVFGSKPVIHTTLKSVKSELERLAAKTPGLQLIYLKIEGAVRAAALVWE